jgi:hypothetical protein
VTSEQQVLAGAFDKVAGSPGATWLAPQASVKKDFDRYGVL